MNKRRVFGPGSLVLVALLSVMAGVIMTARFDVMVRSEAQDFWTEGAAAQDGQHGPESFVDLAKKLSPAVVNISTTQVVKERLMPFPEFRSPFDDFFGQPPFGGGEAPEREFKRQSLGSGFIINKEGYIVTNYHVIENASEIVVTFADTKKDYEAEIVGQDAKLDLALIKIEAEETLPVAPLGDSDDLEIGEWVMAIGNPFGLGGTVTAGIVSQKGRVIGAGPYDNFIQTDASINPGNSGGPLFNMRGEVVGINTAIYAGGQGIGFAIPINMAKDVILQLKEKGKVTRGWIGVSIQAITPEIAESFGLEEQRGALVAAVNPGDPADKGGLKAGDVIIEFDGKPIDELSDLPRTVAATPPGKTVKVKVLRDGKELTLEVTVAERAEEGAVAAGTLSEQKLGFTVQPLTPELAERFGLDSTDGVLISSVDPSSPAAEAGLRRGDIIKEVGRRPVKNMAEFKEALRRSVKKKIVLFLIERGKGTFYAAVKLKD